MKSDIKLSVVLTTCFGLLFSKLAFCSVTTSILPVNTVVTANCSMNSALLNFGDYNPILANKNAPLDAMTTFVIQCTKGANVTISMNNGLYAGNANQTTRAMADGAGNYISYELYSNSGRSSIWNNANPVSFISASSTARNQAVYGRVPGAQSVSAGTYRDTVTITAAF